MMCSPRGPAAATADWPDLVDELDRWGEAGRVAGLWWRDDDAVTVTRQLTELLQLTGDVPLALAAIPALARPELAAFVHGSPRVAVLQHGWRHANHADGGRKNEFPAGRPKRRVAAELGAGRARLKALFAGRAIAMFVPPWNRFAEEFVPLLGAAGIAGLSAMAAGKPGRLPAPLTALDVHVDLVAWRGDRGFVGTKAALGGLVWHLRTARRDSARSALPIGILTHHLIMDRATSVFIERLIAVTRRHEAARWASPAEFLA
jgi:hypothetical protein